jgi:hypothetical protein
MTPIDERMRDLADQAADQCEALANKLTAILDGVDEDGEDEPETLRGLATDKGRLGLIFAEGGVSHRRTWIYVDAILALSEMIKREPEWDQLLRDIKAERGMR